MRGERDDQLGARLELDGGWIFARRHEAGMESGVDRGQMVEKLRIDANQAFPTIKFLEGNAERQLERAGILHDGLLGWP